MSTTTQAPPLPIRTGVRRYAVLAALLLAILAGVVTAPSLIGSDSAPISTQKTVVDGTAGGSNGCTHQMAVAGGLVEGTHLTDGCGAPGGAARSGGVQP